MRLLEKMFLCSLQRERKKKIKPSGIKLQLFAHRGPKKFNDKTRMTCQKLKIKINYFIRVKRENTHRVLIQPTKTGTLVTVKVFWDKLKKKKKKRELKMYRNSEPKDRQAGSAHRGFRILIAPSRNIVTIKLSKNKYKNATLAAGEKAEKLSK